MIKIKIIYKQINIKNKAGFMPCPHNRLKLVPDVSCGINCSRYMGMEGGYLFCGEPGTNRTLKMRHEPNLWEVLKSYDEDWRGALV